jgi:RNA polymerase sigma-70 factor (ECF subfamily)
MIVPMTADLTELLRRTAQGDKEAEQELLPRVYRELHRLAAGYLRRERPDHTLQATALVNEAYLRLAGHQDIDWKGRAHFFAIAAKTMRRILVDYARQRGADKRGAGGIALPLDEGLTISADQSSMVTEIDAALERLEKLSPRQAKVVELRFFTGLSEEEIGEVLGISARTVKRDWTVARAWLYGELSR